MRGRPVVALGKSQFLMAGESTPTWRLFGTARIKNAWYARRSTSTALSALKAYTQTRRVSAASHVKEKGYGLKKKFVELVILPVIQLASPVLFHLYISQIKISNWRVIILFRQEVSGREGYKLHWMLLWRVHHKHQRMLPAIQSGTQNSKLPVPRRYHKG